MPTARSPEVRPAGASSPESRRAGVRSRGLRRAGCFLALVLLTAACGGEGTGVLADGSLDGAVPDGAPVDGTPPPDASLPAFRECRGRPFTPLPDEGWRHTTSSWVVQAGAPNHAAKDVIIKPGLPPELPGKFSYGWISKDLEDEDVAVFLDDCDGWRDLGRHATNTDGRIRVPAPDDLGTGVYEARFQVLGDGTMTTAFLWVLPAGTRLMVTDIDGTLTASDRELFEQMYDGTHVPVAYPNAVELTLAHRERRWVDVYLTGRPYWLQGKTRAWLDDLGFQPGPLRVTDSNEQSFPSESGVGAFKLAFLEGLLAEGYVIDFAYGNATTDIYAYLGAGLPPERVWIIGDNGGQQGTHDVNGDWGPRTAEVQALTQVPQPFTW